MNLTGTAKGYPRRPAPALCKVRQDFPSEHIEDARTHTRQRLQGLESSLNLRSGWRVAITAGSRGMGGFVDILSGIIDFVRQRGAEPVLVPSMGSHGGATAAGQTRVLELLGVSPETVGAPIEATMDTVLLGAAPNGAEVHVDAIAAKCDAIVVLGQVKLHPEWESELGSGLLKMITAGLGKQIGAQHAHSHGLWDSVRAVPRVVMEQLPILCGVAVVENACGQPVRIEVVPAEYDAFLESDKRLLKLARSHWTRLPFEQLDVLVVDAIGKNISGAGMDPNVVGRWRVSSPRRKEPDYHRIVVRSLTPESLGNGMGVGMADIVTERFVQAYDPHASYINMLTASEPGNTLREISLPVVMPTDRDAIEVAAGAAAPDRELRFCRIRSTARLGEFWISESLLQEAKAAPRLIIDEEFSAMQFDSAGNLADE